MLIEESVIESTDIFDKGHNETQKRTRIITHQGLSSLKDVMDNFLEVLMVLSSGATRLQLRMLANCTRRRWWLAATTHGPRW